MKGEKLSEMVEQLGVAKEVIPLTTNGEKVVAVVEEHKRNVAEMYGGVVGTERLEELREELGKVRAMINLIGQHSFGDVEADNCTCGNVKMGFNCVCKWVREHLGDNEYTCEFCGLYKASVPKCSECEGKG